jgi:type I restriction enzyme S subunit
VNVVSIKLKELVFPTDERNPPKQTLVLSVSERLGIVPQHTLFRKKIAKDDLTKYKRVYYGDVIYNPYLLWNGAVGVCFEREGGCVSPAYIVLRPKNKGTERFLYYFFRSHDLIATVDRIATGSVTRRRTAPLDDILDLEFILPDVNYQREIDILLTLIDDKIELNHHINQTIEAIAQTIFKSWFVDFDPVRYKAARQDPPRLARNIADLFPDAFEESDLGEIPHGWKVGHLGTIAAEVRDAVHPEGIEKGTPYIALEDMPRRSIALDSWGVGDDIASGKLRFKTGDILFGKLRPYLHKVGPAPVDGVCSTDIVVCRPRKYEWYGLMLSHMISKSFIANTDRGSTGTKMPRTNWREMSAYKIVLPTAKLAGQFTEILEPMIRRVLQSVYECNTLAAIRDALLPKLISGELPIPDAERIVGRCM